MRSSRSSVRPVRVRRLHFFFFSVSRLDRRVAKNRITATLATSEGWNWIGPMRTQRFTSLSSTPRGLRASTSRRIAATMPGTDSSRKVW